ncbi:hypothetical protein B0H67DRAFT_480099 [Lasiosphaeris hirsuta]|uniref:Actin-like ATPase domain-containing protein n=1 Tax=Lasiosphaeris hirsuta TaxID=260670 RepID=A0AA40E3T9_9PEZI|nr:hypothetical protein B0H67DRAFT_480099 [Lasiosphaeris hirsuta]
MAARVVIGLDFGTTYSGVAHCDNNGAREGTAGVKLITGWPGISNATNEKVPSRIAYSPPPNAQILWGNQIKHNTKAAVHACMKLRLDEKMKGSEQFRLLLAFLTSRMTDLDVSVDDLLDKPDGPPEYPGKDPVDMVADYLTKVREWTWVEMERTYGAEMFASMRKELVVTVPAVWSERAKDLTLKAVQRAKFDAAKTSMVTEPEAAAIYTLKGMLEGYNKSEIRVGDVFVLCDAGGGTVDLISYKITQVQPVFRIEEAAIGSGDKCGATYVDKEFLSWLEQWIGEEAYKKIPAAKTRHGSQMMNAFETAKCNFSGEEDDTEIGIPAECGIDDDDDLNIEDRVLTFKKAQMQQMFDPCVNRTLELIDGQVDSVMKAGLGKPSMVFVVGGFGRNPYLYRKVQEYCSQRGIGTRQPQFPWSAVARGAVCRGLEGGANDLIAVRLARKHYGTAAAEPFRPSVHHPDDMIISEITGRKLARGQMTWLCERGDRLSEAHPKTIGIEVSRMFEPHEEREVAGVLVGCSEDVPPKRFADPAAQVICRVRADFSDIPLSSFPKSRSVATGKEYYELEFKLEATFKSDEIKWRLLYRGKEYGSTSVTYEE